MGPPILEGGGGGPFLPSSGLVKTIQYIRIAIVSLAAVSADTALPGELIDNSNPIRNVRTCLRSSYRLSVHLSNKVHAGVCGLCGFVPLFW